MVSIKCKEILCLLYSVVLFLSGIFLIGFSIVLSYKLFYHFKFVPADTVGPFALIFFVGFVHLLLTWLGVKGPTKEHDFHIIMFIVVTALLVFIEISTGIWAMVIWYRVEDKAGVIMKESLLEYVRHDYYKKEWTMLEKKLHCCGLDGLNDYEEKGSLPLSCCSHDVPSNISCGNISGCREPFMNYIETLMMKIALTGFFSGLFQVIGVVLFYIFYKTLKLERISRSTLRRSRMNSRSVSVAPQPVPIPVASAPVS